MNTLINKIDAEYNNEIVEEIERDLRESVSDSKLKNFWCDLSNDGTFKLMFTFNGKEEEFILNTNNPSSSLTSIQSVTRSILNMDYVPNIIRFNGLGLFLCLPEAQQKTI